MKYVTGAHFDEVKPAGARNLYSNPIRVGMLGRHGWRNEAVIQPFELHLVTWEQDLRDQVASFDETLDLLDELQDSLEDEPEIRSATISRSDGRCAKPDRRPAAGTRRVWQGRGDVLTQSREQQLRFSSLTPDE
jgi:hypothetical protein